MVTSPIEVFFPVLRAYEYRPISDVQGNSNNMGKIQHEPKGVVLYTSYKYSYHSSLRTSHIMSETRDSFVLLCGHLVNKQNNFYGRRKKAKNYVGIIDVLNGETQIAKHSKEIKQFFSYNVKSGIF